MCYQPRHKEDPRTDYDAYNDGRGIKEAQGARNGMHMRYGFGGAHNRGLFKIALRSAEARSRYRTQISRQISNSMRRKLRLGVTFVHVTFYFKNFLTYFPPQNHSDGTLAFGFPQGEMPMCSNATGATFPIDAPR